MRGPRFWMPFLAGAATVTFASKCQIGDIYFDSRDNNEFDPRSLFLASNAQGTNSNPNNFVLLHNINTSWAMFAANDANKNQYGPFAGLVTLMTTQFSDENVSKFSEQTPPLYFKPYYKWTSDDFVELHDAYPNVFGGFVGMYNALFRKSANERTPAEQITARQAYNAIVTLSNGDTDRYVYALRDAQLKILNQQVTKAK